MDARATLYGVGVGPGDPELLTLKAMRVIERCQAVAAPRTARGATVALDIVRGAVDLSGKEIVYLDFAMSRDAEVVRRGHEAAAALIVEQLEQGRDVAMLNLGDVSIYATYSRMKELVEQAGYPTCRIPGVPSFCAAAAVLDADLTPRMDAPLHIVPAGWGDLSEALALEGSKVIMKAGSDLLALKEELRRAGCYEKASLVRDCGLPGQSVARSLDDAPDKGSYFATMVVRP